MNLPSELESLRLRMATLGLEVPTFTNRGPVAYTLDGARAAFHEAGHAIVAEAVGERVAWVLLHVDGGGRVVSGACRVVESTSDPLARAARAFGGIVAERLKGWYPERPEIQRWGSDIESVDRALGIDAEWSPRHPERHPGREGAYLRAREILTAPAGREALERLGRALLDLREMTGPEVREIIAGARWIIAGSR